MKKTMQDYIHEVFQEMKDECETYAGEFYEMACARRIADEAKEKITPCVICGDTRKSEGWECPGCGSI